MTACAAAASLSMIGLSSTVRSGATHSPSEQVSTWAVQSVLSMTSNWQSSPSPTATVLSMVLSIHAWRSIASSGSTFGLFPGGIDWFIMRITAHSATVVASPQPFMFAGGCHMSPVSLRKQALNTVQLLLPWHPLHRCSRMALASPRLACPCWHSAVAE